jgi:deazaflavin-dependent oxidoreductase (nitroreductase family)
MKMSSRYGDFNRALMEDLRANEGRATSGPFKGKDVLILHTKGAKSGEEREAVLGYLPDKGHYILIASKGGAPSHPSWYHNLVANPETTIEVLGKRIRVRARITAGDERVRLFAKVGATAPGYLEYQQRTSRTIPVIVLEPLKQ